MSNKLRKFQDLNSCDLEDLIDEMFEPCGSTTPFEDLINCPTGVYSEDLIEMQSIKVNGDILFYYEGPNNTLYYAVYRLNEELQQNIIFKKMNSIKKIFKELKII